MKEINDWLRGQSIPADPYLGDSSPSFYLQLHAPKNHRQIDAFIRHYFKQIIPDSETLIHLTNWGACQESEMVAVAGIRAMLGEDRKLIDAPGHVISAGEEEIGVSLYSLAASFGWSSYLYSSKSNSTLFNWEGEIFDFWTDSEEAMLEMKRLLNHFDLSETDKRENDAEADIPASASMGSNHPE